jgi:regulator of protease activity HflC (stomatin/prohibitin superfamily)
VTIPQSHVGLLYEDGVFSKPLPPGKHELRRGLFDAVEREVTLVDLRERSLVIKGQEILTRDKVAIRVSLLVYFRVVDPEAAVHAVEAYEARIYEDVQLAARRFLASRNLDAILSDRNEISDAVREAVGAQARAYGVEIKRADVKDLVFPGNLREIMNQVLETERRNEARLIQAKKDIEAQSLKAQAEIETARLRLEAQRQRQSLQLDNERREAEAEIERRRAALKADVEEAQALAVHPELMRLRELRALVDMSHDGAKLFVGLKPNGFGKLLEDNDD